MVSFSLREKVPPNAFWGADEGQCCNAALSVF